MVGAPTAAVGPRHVTGRRWEFLYFALRNKKLMLGLSVEAIFVLLAIFGPYIAPYGPGKFVAPAHLHPSLHHLFGTTYFGEDVFSQMLYSVTGQLPGRVPGCAVRRGQWGSRSGFTAGWRGGLLDEILQMFTNIIVMIPALVLLIVIGAYLKTHSAFFEGIFIGLTTWPWVARAVRAQTFTLKERDFVDLARLSGKRGGSIVAKEIAPNMASYLFLVFILLFAELHADRGELRLPGARADQQRFARRHDEQRHALELPRAAHVVVVHPAGCGHDASSWPLC